MLGLLNMHLKSVWKLDKDSNDGNHNLTVFTVTSPETIISRITVMAPFLMIWNIHELKKNNVTSCMSWQNNVSFHGSKRFNNEFCQGLTR